MEVGSNGTRDSLGPLLILAGGRGRRMGGRDKAALPSPASPDRSLLHVAIEAYGTLGPVWVACGVRRRGDLPVTQVQLLDPPGAKAPGERAGPLAGLYAGFCHALEVGHSQLLSVPVDLSGLRPSVLQALRAELSQNPELQAMVARRERDEPLVAAWRVDRALLDSCRLALASGHGAVFRWQQQLRSDHLTVSAEEPAWINLNTIEDLQRARRLYPLD